MKLLREYIRELITERPATDEERAKMLYFFFRDSSRMGIQLAEMLMPGTAEELVKFVDLVDMFIEMGERLINQKPGEKIDGSLPRLRSIWFEIKTASTEMSKGIRSGEWDVPHAEYLWSNDLLGEVYRSIRMVLTSTFITWTPEYQELLDDLKEWAR